MRSMLLTATLVALGFVPLSAQQYTTSAQASCTQVGTNNYDTITAWSKTNAYTDLANNYYSARIESNGLGEMQSCANGTWADNLTSCYTYRDTVTGTSITATGTLYTGYVGQLTLKRSNFAACVVTYSYLNPEGYCATLVSHAPLTVNCPVVQACNGQGGPGCGGSPIIIPTGPSKDVRLTDAASGVDFDLDADGVKERVAWTVDGEAAFLAMDRNGNGTIDDGSELFGDHTVEGLDNGFSALAALVGGNDEGWATDLSHLLLWHDYNHDGVSQPGELEPAANLLTAVSVYAKRVGKRDPNGNLYRVQGWATTGTGRIPVYDVFLAKQ